ncbi:CMRF35-like molecule 5 isoform X1 [Xyrichtys novacula]|uniref:CMRF35-like molecule 5 isoform X1 n=1 Tax=Xyrichtys novacula TaxID=13765 RepID=A0AAV1EVM1_XYRNO|nr:CMRF35-like molecule 5 isoform X1 [Xyrichtys novacula]
MAQLYVYFCLLSALRTVMTLTVNGRVGGHLTFKCSNWNVSSNVKHNVKYFCSNPCKNDKQIIVKAESEKSKLKDRIEIVNSGEILYVTFFNLQKSDSGKYYCGVERGGWDSYIEVDLTVKDAKPSRPKKTPETVSDMETTSPSASTNGSTVFTDMPTTNETLNMTTSIASASHGAGYALYLIVGLIGLITLLMAGLILTIRIIKKRMVDIAMPQQQPPRMDGDPDQVYQSLNPVAIDQDQVYCTIPPKQTVQDTDQVYQSLNPVTVDQDQVYCTIPPKQRKAALESMPISTSCGS